MRVLWVALAVLFIVPLIQPVGAQTPTPAALLSDGASDVKVEAQGNTQAYSEPGSEALDLRATTGLESPEAFHFTVEVAALSDTSGPVYYVEFWHNDRHYRATGLLGNGFGGGPSGWYGSLRVYDEGQGEWNRLAFITVAPEGANKVNLTVPRALLADSQGAQPFPGRVLDRFVVTAQQVFYGNFFGSGILPVQQVRAFDRMPDVDVGLVPLPVTFGIEQTGNARLASDEPFRYSNGEATTFVFRVNATNLADHADYFTLTPKDAPKGWDVRSPATLIELGAGASKELPVVVRTVFAHDHGKTESFVLEMQSQSDAGSTGRVEMGIHYPAIPQPAGHHDTVYLHAQKTTEDQVEEATETAFSALGGDGGVQGYMNTAEDDPLSQALDVKSDSCSQFGGFGFLPGLNTTYCWYIPLEPNLQLGLDLDLSGLGAFTFPIKATGPLPGARITGSLLYSPPPEGDGQGGGGGRFREWISIASLTPAAAIEVSANTAATLQGTITALPEGDYLPYGEGAGLSLLLRLVTDRPDNSGELGPDLAPVLAPGGSFRLPILEYEDAVDEVFGGASAVAVLTLQSPPQKMVNPGETALFQIKLQNGGPLEETFRLSLTGSNVGWGSILTGGEVTLAAGGSVAIAVAVQPAAQALDDDRADFILEAASTRDISARSLVRLLTIVDTDVDQIDDSELASGYHPPPKGSPGFSFFAFLFALAIVLVRRR